MYANKKIISKQISNYWVYLISRNIKYPYMKVYRGDEGHNFELPIL
jgi:hypothetical protein